MHTPFTLAVRYCLGSDGNVSSRKFVECVSSLNSCPSNWYSTINWQFCLCNTAYCALKGCFQYWMETFDFKNTKCFAHCHQGAYSCIFKQTGMIPRKFQM
eukprot:XP_766600.1 hypothetical protein [Theileria parva strain Muguga]